MCSIWRADVKDVSLFFFYHTMWLSGPKFSDQGLNLGPSSESANSLPLECQGIPRSFFLLIQQLTLLKWHFGGHVLVLGPQIEVPTLLALETELYHQ